MIVDEFDELVNPMRPIPYAVSAVNHITDEMVAGAPVFSVVLEEFWILSETMSWSDIILPVLI